MRDLIDGALRDSSFVRFATELVRNVPAHDDLSEIQAIYQWVLGNVRFTRDPVGKEKLYPPQELLKIRAGDCDDVSMLMAALLMAVGHPARLVTVAADSSAPDQFSHVYVEAETPPGSEQWIPVDAARNGAQFGLAPERIHRQRTWSLTDGGWTDMLGDLKPWQRCDEAWQDFRDHAREHFLETHPLCDRDKDEKWVRPPGKLSGLGQGDGIDWGSIFSQTVQETPQIIAASMGTPTSVRLPSGGTVQTGSPYASFMTPYSPGAAYSTGGYSLQAASADTFSSVLPWLLMGLVAVALFRR